MNYHDKPTRSQERDRLEKAMAALRAERSVLGDETLDIALAAMREKLRRLDAAPQARHEPQQRKLVTILFADVSGFTAMAEKLDHEIVSFVINSLWSRLDKAIHEHGGRIDKHIGDAVMAIFGTPTAREDDPERAILTAIQIQAEVQAWRQEIARSTSNQHSPGQAIQLRVGINTGPALLGIVGTVGEYTAIGDTVNLASRLEHAAPTGGILISEDTYQHVRGTFEVIALKPLRLKGKSERVQVYEVRGVKPRAFRAATRGIEGVETRTIGRDEELAKLKVAFENTADQRSASLVNVVAEAGIGKSRLIYEFGNWLDVQKRPVHLLKGRATLEMSQIPYALLRDILSASFEIHDNDSAAMARQKLERGILSHTGSAETATLHAHFIGHLIGFDFSASPHLKGILGESRQIRDLAFHYGAQLFTEIARERTAVILLEDLHWADKGTLDFFDHLMNTKPDLPLMIVGLTRATLFEQRPDWGSGPIDNVRLDLAPLSEQDSRRLVAEILKKAPEIPSALTDFIVDKAQGSPYYIEELARSLINGGIIIRGEEQWTVEMDRLSDLRVPATLTGLLQARLDRLNADLRETLQQASVVGRIFWSNVVEGMQNPEAHYASSSGTIHDRLDILRSNELVHRYNESASAELPAYIFRNIILHDVTYESVLLKLRPVYHLQAAEGLVAAGGERVSEYAGRVGEHFEHAGEWLKAAEWYARAGRQAQDTYAPDSATAYYEKALKFLDEHGGPVQTPQRLEILARLGEVLNWQARYTDAVETYSTMLKIAEEKGDPVAQSRALQGRAISLEYQGDHRAALESAGRAEGLARSSDAQVELARALWTQGLARYRLGEPQATLSLSEMALAILNEKNNPNEAGRFLNLLGTAYYGMGEYEQAQHHWENTLRIFQRLGNKQQGMDLLNNLGVIADARGDYEAAFRRYSEALELAREVGNRDGEIVFLSNRGIEQVALKNYTAAEADLRQTIEMAGTAGSWCLPNTYNYLAEALLGLGKYDEALHAAQQGLALSIEDGSPENIGGAWRALGLIACKIEEPVKIKGGKRGRSKAYSAHACFAESDRIYSEAEITGERARNLREWAKYEIGQGDKDLGLKMWQEARDLFGKLGAQMEVERMS